MNRSEQVSLWASWGAWQCMEARPFGDPLGGDKTGDELQNPSKAVAALRGGAGLGGVRVAEIRDIKHQVPVA